MNLSIEDAKKLLEKEKGKGDDRWIYHSINVGNYAGILSKYLTKAGVDVNIEKSIILGYLHDIGKYNGESEGHPLRGYLYLKEKNISDDIAAVCLTHSYLNNDILCTAGAYRDPKKNEFIVSYLKNHEYTIEEKIINLCDLMFPHENKKFKVEERIEKIIAKKGELPNSKYHLSEAIKLKKYFDQLLGVDIYDLFLLN